jgi:phage tail sheath protein FI
MLIEKSWTTNDICSIKMLTSEEVIAKVVDSDASSVTISKPLVLQVQMDPRSGQMQMAMIPTFVMGCSLDAKIKIKNEHIICMVLAEEDIKAGYIRQTSSLAVPSSGGIIT